MMSLRSSMVGKLERIHQLAGHGLNTPRMMLIPIGSAFDHGLRDRVRAITAGDRLMTVRTYHPDDEITFAHGPFAPEIPVDEAMTLAEELSRDWNVLFQEAIDVDDTTLAGNIELSPDGRGSYEALAGTYRVRDVENPPAGAEAAVRCEMFDDPAEIVEPQIRDAVERVLRSGLIEDVSEADARLLLEFNVQRNPVGLSREPLLFWEWRPLPSRGNGSRRAARARPGARRVELFGVGVPGLAPPDETHLEATLGGKGAGLTRAFAAGLPVPPFVVLAGAAGACSGRFPEVWRSALPAALAALDRAGRRFFDDGSRRRLAVRSSPSISMPGMLDTFLDVEPEVGPVEHSARQVLESWTSDRAREYRRAHGIAEDAGLAVILLPMVAATSSARSGSGVGFTRHPTTGRAGPEIEFVERVWGTNLVGGDALPLTTAEMRSGWPALFDELAGWSVTLERVQGDMQEFEFAVEDGRACLLQTRRAKRAPLAALRVAYDLVRTGVVDLRQARELLVSPDAAYFVQRRLGVGAAAPVGRGRVASPGVAVGRAAFDTAGVERIARRGDDVVLLATVPRPSDYPLLRRAAAVVSSRGGITSHASVVALEAGIVALVGCRELTVEAAGTSACFGDVRVREGDWLSIDATADHGAIFLGQLPEEAPSPPGDVAPEILSWARALASAG